MAKRILIVDDEDHIRRVMRITMEAAGHETDEAADGYRGLEAFGDGAAWDAVLLDQKMPGMDGLETLRRMKERDPGARVIMVTAYASVELAVDAMKLGATDFVRKPMTPETLRNAVMAALAKPRTPSGVTTEPVAATTTEALLPPISRLTLNGFRFWVDPATADWQRREPHQRRFVVLHPDGRQQDVVVAISADVVDFVARTAHRHLPIESWFWSALAERSLNRFLWNEGKMPPGATLTIVPSGIDRDSIQMAVDWAE